MVWHNDTSQNVTLGFTLKFFDAAGFEIASALGVLALNIVNPIGMVVQAGANTTYSGTFTLTSVTSVDIANDIATMEVWAVFYWT